MYDRQLNRLHFYACFYTLMMAAPAGADQPPPLPTSPEQWINSPVMSYEQVKGKAVFFWFYEETCPKCLAKWTEINGFPQVFEDKPIVFIAVNSGNSVSDVQRYINKVGVKWPVIADVDRSFEASSKIPQISLQNIMQSCYVTHDGEFHFGSWKDDQGTIESALKGASWKIEPDEITDSLKTTWRAMEFGNYNGAGFVLKKALASSKKDVTPSARKLKAALDEVVAAGVDEATKYSDAGNYWLAFEACQRLTEQFQGVEMPSEFSELKKSLLKQPTVKTGTAARKTLDNSRKTVESGLPLTKKGKAQLSKVIADFPDSILARQAEEVMNRSNAMSE